MTIFNLMLSKGLGGLEAMAFVYAKAMARLGYKSAILCNKSSIYDADADVSKYACFTGSKLNPLNYYRLYKLISDLRPAIIVCHGRRAMSFCSVISRFLKGKPKIVGVAHTYWLKGFDKLDGVIAVSKSVHKALVDEARISPQKVMLCENAIEMPESAPRHPDGEEVKIGFIGRLHEVKGVDLLLKATSILKHKGKKLKLLIAGEGSQEAELRRLSSELRLEGNIEWLGWTSDKGKFYSQIDIAVVPSRSEPFGLTVIEAMAHQCAVVAADCEAPRQIVEAADCGLVFKRESVQGLADCLEKLIENPVLRSELATKGRDAALRDYSYARFDRDLAECVKTFSGVKLNHKKAKISVIVPVYNVEKYLARCLDSILTAAKVATEVETEIICVNDGSTDGSAAVLETYADKVRIFHKENGGQGSARNLGLDNMTGDYVMFVDPDDFIPEDAIWKMHKVAEESKLPLVVSMRFLKNKLRPREQKVKWTVRKNAWMIDKKVEYSVCNRLYKASIFEKRRMPKILFEDYPTAVNICADIEKFAAINEPMYVYCDNGVSTTIRSSYSKRKLKDMFTGVRLIMEHKGAFSGDIPERQAVRGVSTVIGKVAKAKDPMLTKLLFIELLRLFREYPELRKRLPIKSRYRLWKLSQ